MQIKCVGRRRLQVTKIDNEIAITILWKDRILATLMITKAEAVKLTEALDGLIGINPGKE
jgi:hypothetical protein